MEFSFVSPESLVFHKLFWVDCILNNITILLEFLEYILVDDTPVINMLVEFVLLFQLPLFEQGLALFFDVRLWRNPVVSLLNRAPLVFWQCIMSEINYFR